MKKKLLAVSLIAVLNLNMISQGNANAPLIGKVKTVEHSGSSTEIKSTQEMMNTLVFVALGFAAGATLTLAFMGVAAPQDEPDMMVETPRAIEAAAMSQLDAAAY